MRYLAAFVAAWGILLVGPAIVGPAGGLALGHANLVVSDPGAGEVVSEAPPLLILTFSEPFEPAYSSVDVLDGVGTAIVQRVGGPDPVDPRIMRVALPPLAAGVYTVDWRTVSSTDGHSASGFFTFGVGDVVPPAGGTASGEGDLHAGHGAGLILLETESRALSDLGFMLAFGLAIAAGLVTRTTTLGPMIAFALLMGAFGSLTLAVVGATSSGSASVDYVLGTRTGLLLVARIAIALLGVAAIWFAMRTRRPSVGIVAGGLAGLAGIGLIVAAGHASGFASPVPVLAAFIHVTAAAIWIGGLGTVVWIAIDRTAVPDLHTVVSRFSALALIAVALVAATGLYADWLLTGAPLRFDSPYAVALLVKILLVGTALAIGALNYADGGRNVTRPGAFRVRVVVEAALAIGILIATGNLASGSPPGLTAPVAIAPAFSTAAAADATLALQPGRPGPTRFIVTVPGRPSGVDLVLTRVDTGSGTSRVAMRPAVGASDDPRSTYLSDGGQLPVRSRWDVTVAVHDLNGAETGRTRFTFAMDATGVAEGRASPPIDLPLVIGVMLLVGSILLGVFTLAGATLPRVEPRPGRVAASVGAVVGGMLGVALLLAGRV